MFDEDETSKVKKFTWSSETVAKEQYDEWLSVLTELCASKGCGQCVDELFTEYFKPIAPIFPGQDASAKRLSKFEQLEAQYQIELQKYQGFYLKALGCLRSTLKYGTKARVEIESVIITPPPVPETVEGQPPIPPVRWTPDLAFKAAMKHLKDNYAPRDAFDATTIRDKLANLNDEEEGSFVKYAEKFTNLYCALVRAGKPPLKSECVSWVNNGIRNATVRIFLATDVFKRDNVEQLFYEDIFDKIRFYLKTLGDDVDPYKTVKSGPRSSAMLSNNRGFKNDSKTDGVIRCTRCWRSGHSYRNCIANTCSACGGSIAGKAYCPAWKSHDDGPMRFVPDHLLKGDNVLERPNKRFKSGDHDQSPGSSKEDPKDTKDPKSPAMQAALKSLRAARKEYKKVLKEGK